MSEELVNIEEPQPVLQSAIEEMATPIRVAVQLESDEAVSRKNVLYNAMKSDFEFKGFRKGKVPRKIAEGSIGKEQLYRSLLSSLVREAAEEQSLDLVAIDKIIVNNIEDGQPLNLSAVIFVMPTVELPDYKNVSIEVPLKPEVTDGQLDIQVRNLMRSSPQTEKRDVTDRTVSKGDLITLDYEPVTDSIPETLRETPEMFAGSDMTFYYREGRTRFVQAFEEAIGELRIDSPLEREVSFPSEYPQPDLAGQVITFKMTLTSHQELVMPTMEDVAKEQGHDSITDWRNALKTKLEEDINAKYTREVDNHIKLEIEKSLLDGANTSPIPDALVDQEAMAFLTQLAKMDGVMADAYLSDKNITFDDFREDMKPIIVRKIQLQVILGAVADAEEFSPSEEDVTKFLEQYSKMNNIPVEDARSSVDDRYVAANLRIEQGYEIVKAETTINYI